MNKICLLIMMTTLLGCNYEPASHNDDPTTRTPFQQDLHFLQRHDSVIVLANGESKVIVSAKYQGKVFTSTADGNQSFGWINYKAFDAPLSPHMNAYGGENRFWLGPEGGKYSLFFPKDSAMEFANWKVPAAFDSEPWELVSRANDSAAFKKEMQLPNYLGNTLHLEVNRTVKVLNAAAMNSLLQLDGHTVKWVGYRTANTVTNLGKEEWNEKIGVPCTWILDMFPTSDQTVVVIPYKGGNLLPANTKYFGKIPDDRITYKNNVLFYKADGKQRGKLGVKPERTLPVAGSYDAANHVLTITLFDANPLGKFINQEWRTDQPAFSGDGMNAYNDGPLEDGSQMGPFYELESVSTALFLPPGQSATHWHSVFHFTGDESNLNRISEKVLGVSIGDIKNVFAK